MAASLDAFLQDLTYSFAQTYIQHERKMLLMSKNEHNIHYLVKNTVILVNKY